MSGTVPPPTIGEKNSTGDEKYIAAIKVFNELLDGANKIPGTSLAAEAKIAGTQLAAAAEITNAQLKGEITAAKLAAAAKPVTWYTPKIIATEETRENAAYGTMTTKDEITGVVLPENGLIVVGYQALVKESVDGAGRVALFLGANQVKVRDNSANAPVALDSTCGGLAGKFSGIATSSAGFQQFVGPFEGEATADVNTGQLLGYVKSMSNHEGIGGPMFIFASAGTYTVSIQFKASSGTITAKERKLWVSVLGF
jgi:hypothetical protein